MSIFDQLQDIFLVSLGAVLGVNIRFIIYKKFEKLNFSKDSSILIINTFSCLLLGFFISILPRMSSYDFSNKLLLFYYIGFLGSLSTFSTFVYDLFNFFLQLKFSRALKLFFSSLSLGLIALVLGFFIGNQ